MTDGYGKKVNNAVKAVRQMYADTSKLLQACDNTIGKGAEPVWANRVTHDVSRHIEGPERWMAREVYRYYKPGQRKPTANQHVIVEGVAVVFVTSEPVDEPLFIVGQFEVEGGNLKWEDRWALQKGFFDWSDTCVLDEVIHVSPPSHDDIDDHNRIKNMKLIAVPLYQIQGITDVQALMDRVRQSP
ncbi:MAG: hypothetical protein OXR07_00140 [Nitrospira sp.]|nr:hypothetical protein [Nitrospira sp.]